MTEEGTGEIVKGYFADKVAAVTGAASGIGLGLTEQLLARGALAVFMGDVNEGNLSRESERLNLEYPGRAVPLLTDVTKEDQVTRLIHDARDFDGHLDFVFNNAGMGMTLPTDQISFETWRFILDLNLMGVIYGTYRAIPIMREQGSGHIINTGSVAGLVPISYQAVYAASKSAVICMTQCLQYELKADGLNFSVFCPGDVATAIYGDMKPPEGAISVLEAVQYILDEVEKKSLIIVFPETCRRYYDAYNRDREAFDKFAFDLADERRENYRTKGTYY